MTKKLIALLLIAIMAMGLFTGCGSDEPAEEQQGGEEMTTLVFGTSADYAPFEFMYPDENGNIAQKTEDIVGPYALHDFFLFYAVRYHYSPKKIYDLARLAFDGIFETLAVIIVLYLHYSEK